MILGISARVRGGAQALGVALLVAAAGLCSPAPASAQEAGPALWRASDDDSELWIFGSVHLLRPDVAWRRPDLMTALEAVDAVYFEAPTDVLSQIAVQRFIAENGYFPPGEDLFAQLSPQAAAALDRVVDEIALDRAMIATMRPWLAFTVISTQLAMASGATLDNGVDAQLTVAAARARKELRAFETLVEQTTFFAEMSIADQVEILEVTVRDFEAQTANLDALVAAWAVGDLDRFETVLFDDADVLPLAFHEILFTRRNAAWARELSEFLRGSGSALVVVGAGHLVGPDSVIALLRRDGWTVERR